MRGVIPQKVRSIMTITIQSIKRSKGTYEGTAYDNTLVTGFVVNSTNEQVLCGEEVEICKFKTPAFNEALSRNLTALGVPEISEVKHLQGLLLSPVYNKFGGCDDFSLALPAKKK